MQNEAYNLQTASQTGQATTGQSGYASTAQPGYASNAQQGYGASAQQQGYGSTTAQQGYASSPAQTAQKLGAQELLATHELLTAAVDKINKFQFYRQNVKDSQLLNILENQLKFMASNYNNLVKFLQNQGAGHAVPYRTPRQIEPTYGLRNPSPEYPNQSAGQIDDRDIASEILGTLKFSALQSTIAALECSNPTLRNIVSNCIQSAVNQAFEVFQFMNQKGMYQVPTLNPNTTATMTNIFQTTNAMPI